MSFVGFKSPRVKDNRHLDRIRAMPCCICGGIDTEAAHIRTGSPDHGKRSTGLSEKPSDNWVVPLCNRHHREQHDHGNELRFWSAYGIDPFALAIKLSGTA
jgi:hypothetical protein